MERKRMVENDGAKEKEKEKGYEALIKPIQDVIAKDWKVRLCNYLDIYIEHIHEPGTVYINFTEAALLVQNTSTYYCKRVDLMYNWVRQFCFTLAEKFLEVTADEEAPKPEEQQPGDQKTNKKKSKKNSKNQLLSDEMELLPYAHTGNKNINFKYENIDGMLIKKVVLNSCMKTQTKRDTCVPVQQSVSEEMGFKDEFRLHWKLANDGRLYEDFRYDTTHIDIAGLMPLVDPPVVTSPPQPHEFSDDDDIGMDGDLNDGMDVEPVSPSNLELSASEHLPNNEVPEQRALDGSDLMPDHLEEVIEAPDKGPKEPEENFFVIIPFAPLIMHRKFKKRQVFKLPKELIEEVAQLRKKQKKNGKNDENSKGKDSDYNYHLSFSEILGGKSEDMIQHKLGKRKAASLAKRKKRNQKQCQDNNNLESAADLNNDTMDDDDHDIDDLVDDLSDPPASQGVEIDAIGEQNQNFENAYEASAKLIGEIFKTKNDPLSITKRVAAWHKMIQPVLAEAEARSVFSVNEYGTRILEKFQEVGEVRPFSEMVTGQPREEICRYFLSTLMLANTYNLEIQKTSNEELAKDCLQMKLLSTVRHHEELDANVGATTANGPIL